MNRYGKIALNSLLRIQSGKEPAVAWEESAKKELGNNTAATKNCPKSTFLGLAEDGLIKGISSGNYTKSRSNKRYAIMAVKLLKQDPCNANCKLTLWRNACGSDVKSHNSQMDVVLSLWSNGLLR